MGKSRQRVTDPKIIDRPELKSGLRRFTEGSFTAVLWALWAYWALPIITLILWLLGFRYLYHKLFSDHVVGQVYEVLKNGGLVILTLLMIKLVWINYNYYAIFKRFGQRRKNVLVCAEEKISRLFNIAPALIQKARSFSRLEVTLHNKELTISVPK